VVLVTTNSGAAPALNAGPDQNICANNTTLNATPTAASPRGWRVVAQPAGANAVFTNIAAPNSRITGLDREGDYVLEWLAFSGCCIGRDTVVIRVNREVTSAFAGNDTSICGNSFLLSAAPIPAAHTGKWSILQEPAGSSASIEEPNRSETLVSPLAQGVYRFVWEVTGSCGGPAAKDTLTLRVVAPSFSFSAGTDSATCLSAFDLWAEPLGAGLSGAWLVLQQPDPVSNPITIAEPNNPNSRVLLPQEGEYRLLWRVTDGNCTMQDTLVLKYDKSLFRLDTLFTTRPICKALGGEIKLWAVSVTPVVALTIQPDTGLRDGLLFFKLLPAGFYTFEARNQDGCAARLRVDLPAITPNLTLTAKDVQPAGCRQANGAITIEVQGGATPYTFLFGSPPQTNATGIFNGLAAGSYPVEAIDANGCVAETTFYVPTLDFEIQQTRITAPACYGANTGQITVVATGTSGPFLYTLEPGNITNSTGVFNNLRADTYTLTVLDKKSCPITLTPLVLDAPPQLELRLATQAPSCTTSDGTIKLSPSGGIPPYVFSLLPNAGQFTNDTAFTNLSAGAYRISVNDQNGCVLDTLVALNPVTDIEIIIAPDDILPASCKGKADGQVLAQVRSLIPIRFYSIFPAVGNNLQNGIFTDLPAGLYIITVTDAVGCSHSKEVIIPESTPFEVSVIRKIDLRCAQSQDGEIQLGVSGNAQPPFAFSIDGGATTFPDAGTERSFLFLQVGDYTPWVRDARGCIVSLPPLRLSAPLPLRWALDIKAPNCPGAASGQIIAKVEGGTLPYNYTLIASAGQSVTQPAGEFLNLAAGKYWLEALDFNGCKLSVQDSLDLTIANPIAMEVDAVYPPLCAGQATASIKLKVRNATAPWKITLSPGNYSFENTDSLTRLPSQSYKIVLQDGSGCEYTLPDSVSINSPLPLQWERFTVEPPACFNGADGSLQVSVNNAAPPLSFTLTDGAGVEINDPDGNFIALLKPGVYSLVAKDNNGCSLDTTFTLQNPEAIVALPDTILCIGQTGGNQIVALVAKQGNTVLNNGTWSGPGVEGTRFASGLVNDIPGVYNPEFTSEKGCKASARIEITNLQVAPSDTICYGLETYQLAAPNLGGGRWKALNTNLQINSATGVLENISQTPSGDYFLVYEAGGCQDTLVLHILPRIEASIITSPGADALYPNQPITFGVNTQDYATIYWDFGILSQEDDTSRANTPVFRYPEKGTYTVKALLTNGRGCRSRLEKELEIRWLLDPFIPNVITPNGDGVNDGIELNFSSLIRLTFTVFDSWGKKVYQTDDPKARWEPRKNELNPGTYYYLLQFENPENGQKHNKTGNIAVIY
jgi:gliding motility-associated-like protein